MDRTEVHPFAFAAVWMPRDHLAAAAHYDPVDMAAQPDVAVATGNRNRVIRGPAALRRTCGLITGLEGRNRKVGHRDPIPLKPFSDGFRPAAGHLRPRAAAVIRQIRGEFPPLAILRFATRKEFTPYLAEPGTPSSRSRRGATSQRAAPPRAGFYPWHRPLGLCDTSPA